MIIKAHWPQIGPVPEPGIKSRIPMRNSKTVRMPEPPMRIGRRPIQDMRGHESMVPTKPRHVRPTFIEKADDEEMPAEVKK